MIPQASMEQRHVVIDLVTSASDGSCQSLADRILAISVLIDDGRRIIEQSFIHDYEPFILKQFWDAIRIGDLLIGLTALDEMLDFLRRRSLTSGIVPADERDLRKWYSHETINVIKFWRNWIATPKPDLLTLPDCFDMKQRHHSNTQIQKCWEAGDFDGGAFLCRDLVRVAYEAWLCLTFQEIPERYHSCPSVTRDLRATEPTVRCH